MKNRIPVFFAGLALMAFTLHAQQKLVPDSALVNGLKFRSIGPAAASGRIADFAANPFNSYEYYVAVASGHIWKTTNNGITFNPVFDQYGAYSIGCLAIDPVNPNIVWAGTGENNSQRALGYGNGVYKTLDGGASWVNMGLKNSFQIGKILIDPRNSEVVYVAAEGSVWGPGGDRGIFKTTDGGKTWTKVLEISENTGAYDLEFHPSNPDIIYASAHQRRRHTYTKINGGPESALYKTTNAGKDWRKITTGLPSVHLGRIGLAVCPADPNLVYAIVEAADNMGGFFRSDNQGESWQKMSDYTSSGQYYTEIECDPENPLRVYSVDTYSQVTEDGGKTWKKLSTKKRHVDDHALWINPKATSNIRIGGDGGVYESYDRGESWTFFGNLPVTQFYRVNVDNSLPFYRVYGGTQDNNTLGGPSQNLTAAGVSNDEWFYTLGGDGFWVAIDPEDPDIVFCEYQYGNAYRYNHKNGELVYIKPQEPKGEVTYKWNWDTPLILSSHNNQRLYMAANKIFRSDNRGDSWSVISGDLTAQKDRNDFKVMGKYWSSDAVTKDVSTSLYGTIVSLAESPINEQILVAGTDDGLIQVTSDGGKTWNKTSSFTGIPEYTYVSDVLASRFDENVIYATFNNNKSNDFKPYVLQSRDKGKTWTSIASNLPQGAVYNILQDIKNPKMLFCGTEFGLFVTFNEGTNWIQIRNGLPDVAVRDLVIQERENDLVIATFGRGFYILQNYSVLKEISLIEQNAEAHLFTIPEALLYIPKSDRRDNLGDNLYIAPNKTYGAEISYYLKEDLLSAKEKRQKSDAELFEAGSKIKVNTWEEDRLEKLEEQAYLLFVVEDAQGNVIRKITAPAKKGINRVYWDLKYPDLMPVKPDFDKFDPLKAQEPGLYSMPGTYQVRLYASEKGVTRPLTEKISFEVKALNATGFNDENRGQTLAFQQEVAKLTHNMVLADQQLAEAKKEIHQLKQRNLQSTSYDASQHEKLVSLEQKNAQLLLVLNGYEAKASYEEVPPAPVPLMQRLGFLINSFISNSEATNQAQKESLEILRTEFASLVAEIKAMSEEVKTMEPAL